MARRIHLTEDVASGRDRVDYERAVVRGVKIIGLKSANGRIYTMEALRKAVRLYEGCPVNSNHPRQATTPRKTRDRIGWLENVQLREDGLYGDLHLLKKHPETAQLLEIADRRPSLLGLSHNADGDTYERRDGTVIVEALTKLRSVDIVCDPATNKSLFESRTYRSNPMKFRTLLESLSLDHRLPGKVRKRLLEAGEDLPDDTLDTPLPDDMDSLPTEDAPAVDPMQALKDGFKAALSALATDDTMDMAQKLKKLKELLKAEEQLLAETASAAGTPDAVTADDDMAVTEEEECDDDDDDKKKTVTESKKKRMKESVCRNLCQLAGVEPATELLESLQALGTLAAATRHLSYVKSLGGQRSKNRPVTTSPHRYGPAATTVSKDRAAFLKEIVN